MAMIATAGSRTRALAALTAMAVSSGLLAADATSQQAQTPVFRAGIDVVQVDVSVIDRTRRPVRNLTAADFTVLENGVPQSIVGFVPVDVPEPDPVDAAWEREVAADVTSNALGDGRLFAIVMDDATIPSDGQLVNRARAIARSVIDRLGPSDLAAVIFTRDNRHGVDFTRDRARLIAAVNKITPGFAYAGQRMADEYYWFYSSIRTLGQVSSYLRSVPQRRKAIVYVSTGVPVDTDAAAQAVAIGANTGSLIQRDIATELLQNTQETFTTALQDTFLRAQHGNVNIYAIDPSGVGGLNFYFQNQTNMSDGRPRGLLGSISLSRLNREFLQTVSGTSGGRAIVNTDKYDEGIAQIFRENSSYYLVGYQSTRPREDRRIRRVEVKVNRPDVEVRTRSAYFDERREILPDSATPALKLTNALANILPSPDIELWATAAPFPQPGRPEAAVAVVLGVRQPPPTGPDAEVREALDLLVSAFTPAGEPRGSQRRTIRMAARTGEPLIYDVVTRLDLKPGRYQIRLAAESDLLDKTGSVYTDVEVPDFARDALSLAGLMLASSSAPSLPPGALDGLVPLDATSRRTFSPTDRVRAFTQVVQGGSGRIMPVDVTIRITDTRNAVVSRTTESLAADRFGAGRTADVGFELPLGRLQRGSRYLLTVEVSRGGRSARRDVMFEVD